MSATSAYAVSDVGRVRSSNQDSGYVGRHLFLVADGMGGHAGGDVASALTARRLSELDRQFGSAEEARAAIQSGFADAAAQLSDAVAERPELTGMGTTVSAIIRLGGSVVLGHIGDSRVYVLRDGELTQVTADHTFVQRLVDSGRITAEEAAIHPKRSVLMRVLGDIDMEPDVDTMIIETQPGDRWLLCSDGLSSYVAEDAIRKTLGAGLSLRAAGDRLLSLSLEAGAPDNVTVVLLDIGDDDAPPAQEPELVGAAAGEITHTASLAIAPRGSLAGRLLSPLRSTPPEDAHFEPEVEAYLAEIIAEDAVRAKRRRIGAVLAVIGAVLALGLGLFFGYQYTQTLYYVGESDGVVAIYQGVQQSLGPISLSSVYELSSVDVDDLPMYRQEAVENTISARDLAHAHAIVEELSRVAGN